MSMSMKTHFNYNFEIILRDKINEQLFSAYMNSTDADELCEKY